MYYYSTRNKKLKLTSAEAIKKGLSEEGGLFVPSELPKITSKDIDNLVGKSYIDRANYILKLFLTDFTSAELSKCTSGAYGGGKFSSEKVAPLVRIGDEEYILELWHGPTCAFKDMALQILPYFMTTAMKKTGEDKEIVILVATSGDTGKAALEGFKDVDGTRIIVFYPEDGVSDIQKLQMVTQEGKNVGVYGIDGNFDDAQNGVKKIFTCTGANAELNKNGFALSSANSINWGRLVPQIVYYISAYCDMVEDGEIQNGDKINICVPTGNFGNILAAYYAKQMGLLVNKFICASNRNNVLTDFINTGVYDKNREFFQSVSPSMDILISSNLERLLFDVSGRDDKVVSELMSELSEKGRYELPEKMREKIQSEFWGGYCDDYFTKVRIWKTNYDYGYTLDTHTAVAVDVYHQYTDATGDKTKTVIASTASPFKFNDTVLSALGQNAEGKSEDELLNTLKDVSGMEIPKSLAELSSKRVRFTESVEPENMYDAVKSALGIK